MIDLNNIVYAVIIAVVGVCIGYLFYKYFIREKLLEPSCLLGSKTCLKISYYKYENSILFKVMPEGYWAWFDGEHLYIYDGNLTNSKCPTHSKNEKGEDIVYQQVYKLNRVPVIANTTNTHEIACIEQVSDIVKYYESLNVKKKYLYKRLDKSVFESSGYTTSGYKQPSYKWSVYDTMNLLQSKKLWNFP